jgi:putative AdoMet-dependent methyltransferase
MPGYDHEVKELQRRRSTHVDRFNHDEDAPGYDADVLDETNPIRAGYGELLEWTARQAHIHDASRVLEIGSGTGNLTRLLPHAQETLCVDISAEMTKIASTKLASRPELCFFNADALEALHLPEVRRAPLHAIVSTYTLHHLTEAEKREFTETALQRLAPGGRLVVGDLMFKDEAERGELLLQLGRKHGQELVEEIEDEFFWDLTAARRQLEQLGVQFEARRFSELTWGLLGVAAPASPGI